MDSQVPVQPGPLLIVQADVPGVDEGAGDYQYRAYAPGAAMAGLPDIYTINLTNEHRRREAVYAAADVLILNNLCDIDLLPLIHRRRCAGRPTVYEINDDLFNVPPGNPQHAFYAIPENRATVEQLARSCDAIQFSTPSLLRKYGHWSQHTAAFVNHLHFLPREKRFGRRDQVIVGWGGSLGHYHDLAGIAPALVRWLLGRPDVKFHFMGADRLWELFAPLPDHGKRRFPPGSLPDYYGFLETLDIGLAPLEDTPYNQSRSDVKFLEYAAHGVIPVLQNAEPYRLSVEHGKTGFLFAHAEELVAILDRLVADFHGRVRLSVAARDHVARKRSLTDHLQERLCFYRGLMTAASPPRAPQTSPGLAFQDFAAMEGGLLRGRHLVLMPTAFELMLRDLLKAQALGSREQAYHLLQLAASLEPNNYLPYLYGAGSSPDTVSSLQLALARNPCSIKALMLLASLFQQQGNPSAAAACLRRSRQLLAEISRP